MVQKEHEYFKRIGIDLVLEKKISLKASKCCNAVPESASL